MALFVAAKFSQEEMPKVFDPGKLQDLKPQDFIVVPRNGSEDVAFVAALEHKSSHQLKLRRQPYPRVIRRASQEEVERWWERKALERHAMALCKEKAQAMKLDMKISHVRIDMKENRAIFHFTSEQRVDFRALVRDLSALLKVRIDLWQIGVRDEARMVDGFGVCGLQTCCSTWLKEFRPITIRMAKDQDINLPPNKLSGQCGRLLCCLSYEVDQYRELSKKALPKGATVRLPDGKQGIIVDRNLIAGTYLVSDEGGLISNLKEEELNPKETQVPEQMKRFAESARQMAEQAENGEAPPPEDTDVPSTLTPVLHTVEEALPAVEAPAPERDKKRPRGRKGRRDGRREDAPKAAEPQAPASPREKRPDGRSKRRKGKKPVIDPNAVPPIDPNQSKAPGSGEGKDAQDKRPPHGRRKKRRHKG